MTHWDDPFWLIFFVICFAVSVLVTGIAFVESDGAGEWYWGIGPAALFGFMIFVC